MPPRLSRMLPALALIVPMAPFGTTTPTTLCRWLEAATGTPHAFAAELRDYPLFLSLHSSAPARVESLIARALAGEWVKDGTTLRLMPIKPKPDEGLTEFVRDYKASVDPKSALAAIPAEQVYAITAGGNVRYGYPIGRYVRPLPEPLKTKVERSQAQKGYVYLSRIANGLFQTRTAMPNGGNDLATEITTIQFRTLPPEVVAALGDGAKATALDKADQANLERIVLDPASRKVDPQKFDHVDPLAGLMDPLLKPLATKLREDLVVPLLDMSVAGMTADSDWSVKGVLSLMVQTVDWTATNGAFVGRLPAFERRNRTQSRRSAVARLVAQSDATGVASPKAMADYLTAQRPAASEGWGDIMMLVVSGAVYDETHIGDYPYNFRFSAALSDRDWERLRSGSALVAGDLSPKAKAALFDVLTNSKERLVGTTPDPAMWPRFPEAPLALSAKVEEDDVVIGLRGVSNAVMEPFSAGSDYARQKAESGREPLYRPGRRRRLTLKIARGGQEAGVETGFGEVSLDPKSKAVTWNALPPEALRAFQEGMNWYKGERANGSTIQTGP